MNIDGLKQAIFQCLDKHDRGEHAQNPFMQYFDSESEESSGEKEQFVLHMYQKIVKDIEAEHGALIERREEVEMKMNTTMSEYNTLMEDTMHLDSLFQKIYDLKRLHLETQNEAHELFPVSTPESVLLAGLDRKAEEQQASLDAVQNESGEIRRQVDASRQTLEEHIRDYEEKKSQEEQKLELLLVIQNVIKKKRNQIVERNATLVELKKEIHELELQIPELETNIQTVQASMQVLKESINEPRNRLIKLEMEKTQLNKEMATVEREIDYRMREEAQIERIKADSVLKLKKRIEVFKDKTQMYEDKAKLRLKLQGLMREMEEYGLQLEIDPKVKSIIK